MTQEQTILELVEGPIDATAKTYAEGFFQFISPHLDEGMRDAILDFTDAGGELPVDEKLIEDLILPAMHHRITAHLVTQLTEASKGWSEVFYSNLREHYNATGEV